MREQWESTSTSPTRPEMVNGHLALTMDSVLLCNHGGIIMPITSGQGYERGVDWAAFRKRFLKMIRWAAGKNLLCHVFGGDPINMNTGNFIYEKEDLVSKGKRKGKASIGTIPPLPQKRKETPPLLFAG